MTARLASLPPRKLAAMVALGLAAIIAMFGIVYGAPTKAFEGLDAEWTPASFFSGFVLFAAAWLVYQHTRRDQAVHPLLGFGLAALLAVMGLDEIVALHERLENRTGIDWEILYAPLVLLAAIGGLMLLRTLPRAAALCFLAGGLCWFGAQVIEAWQWDGDVLIHPFSILPEELGEMTGSSLFVVSMLLARPPLEAAPARKGAPERDLVGVLEVAADRKS